MANAKLLLKWDSKLLRGKRTECNELLLMVGGLHSLFEGATFTGDKICLDQELVQLILLLALHQIRQEDENSVQMQAAIPSI